MNSLKITTILGTRPEVIRLSVLLSKMDSTFSHRLVHTNQNSDTNLNEIFFKDLKLRNPDVLIESENSSIGTFLGSIFPIIEKELIANRPDAIILLGDTNSGLVSIIARKLHIPIFHLEAGNRSFDNNVPEEINRKIIDHISNFNLVYTEHARRNLISEGIDERTIILTGSPLKEVLEKYDYKIKDSKILESLSVEKNKYFLMSIHRQENLITKTRVESLVETIKEIVNLYNLPIIITGHPRLLMTLDTFNIQLPDLVRICPPFNFTDYSKLQINSRIVISDSGTLSEESSILKFKAISFRNSTERPEGIESGIFILGGIDKTAILQAISILLDTEYVPDSPNDYVLNNFSEKVIRIIQSLTGNNDLWFGIHKDSQ
jgi:UDP-N-acetylglucosamine 2-epimerase (non-hydrolysing)